MGSHHRIFAGLLPCAVVILSLSVAGCSDTSTAIPVDVAAPSDALDTTYVFQEIITTYDTGDELIEVGEAVTPGDATSDGLPGDAGDGALLDTTPPVSWPQTLVEAGPYETLLTSHDAVFSRTEGQLEVFYVHRTFDEERIQLIVSTDEGATWSVPKLVHFYSHINPPSKSYRIYGIHPTQDEGGTHHMVFHYKGKPNVLIGFESNPPSHLGYASNATGPWVTEEDAMPNPLDVFKAEGVVQTIVTLASVAVTPRDGGVPTVAAVDYALSSSSFHVLVTSYDAPTGDWTPFTIPYVGSPTIQDVQPHSAVAVVDDGAALRVFWYDRIQGALYEAHDDGTGWSEGAVIASLGPTNSQPIQAGDIYRIVPLVSGGQLHLVVLVREKEHPDFLVHLVEGTPWSQHLITDLDPGVIDDLTLADTDAGPYLLIGASGEGVGGVHGLLLGADGPSAPLDTLAQVDDTASVLHVGVDAQSPDLVIWTTETDDIYTLSGLRL